MTGPTPPVLSAAAARALDVGRAARERQRERELHAVADHEPPAAADVPPPSEPPDEDDAPAFTDPPGSGPGPRPADDGDDPGTAVDRRRLALRAQVLDVAGLRNIAPPSPLVDGWLYRDSLAWLGGKPGHGKSFAAVDLACCIGTGRPWHGHDVTRGRVLYLIAEGAAGLGARVDAWSLAAGVAVAGVLFLPVPVQLLDPLDGLAFVALLAELRPDLVILDTQARVSVGGEENSSRDMGRLVDVLERLRAACGCCVLVVHHEARGAENLRGSTALEGAATTIVRSVKDGQAVEITNPKQKDGPAAAPLRLTLAPCGRSVVLSHEAVGQDRELEGSALQLLGVLRDSFGTRGATKTELIAAADMPSSTYYRARGELLKRGLMTERKEGRSTFYTAAADDPQTEIPTSPTESHD